MNDSPKQLCECEKVWYGFLLPLIKGEVPEAEGNEPQWLRCEPERRRRGDHARKRARRVRSMNGRRLASVMRATSARIFAGRGVPPDHHRTLLFVIHGCGGSRGPGNSRAQLEGRKATTEWLPHQAK